MVEDGSPKGGVVHLYIDGIDVGPLYIDVSNSGGFVLPVGTGADRPVTPLLGMIRYNTNDERVELYDGSQWGSIAGSSGAVSIIDATEIAVQIAVTLG